jgi:hypothetical protein
MRGRRLLYTLAFHDADGTVLFEEIRRVTFEERGEGKYIRMRRPHGALQDGEQAPDGYDPEDGYCYTLDGLTDGQIQTPYALPHLIEADPKQVVYITEGPRKAQRLIEEGLLATANVGGAGHWTDLHSRWLKDRWCVILPDHDAQGSGHAEAVRESLMREGAARVVIVALPELTEHGDILDWLQGGHTVEDLEALVRAAFDADWRTEAEPPPPVEESPPPAPEPTQDAAGEAAGPKERSKEDDVVFPTDLLPKAVADLIHHGAQAIGCPEDLIGVHVLGVASAAIGATREIEIKPGWTEPAIIWSAVIALTGEKKSPGLRLATEAFTRRMKALQKQHREDVKAWRTEQAKYEIDLATWNANKKDPTTASAANRPWEPVKPRVEQCAVTDTTMEALGDVLDVNRRGILVNADELSAWVLSMNQYKQGGRGSDRANWLKAWNRSPVALNRRNREEPLILMYPFVTVIGLMTTDTIGLLSAEEERAAGDDGFVHRLLFSYHPTYTLEDFTWDGIPAGVVNAYCALMDALFALKGEVSADTLEGDTPAMEPQIVTLGAGAKQVWEAWIHAHYKERRAKDFPGVLQGPWAKMDGYCARLALILYEQRKAAGVVADDVVDAETMRIAVRFIAYFKAHARMVYGQLHVAPETTLGQKVLAWIDRWDKYDAEVGVLPADIVRANIQGVKTAAHVKQVFRELAELGEGKVETHAPKTGGPRTVKFIRDEAKRKAAQA